MWVGHLCQLGSFSIPLWKWSRLYAAVFCLKAKLETMQKITAITAQRRNKERVNIHLDGEYAFSLAMITAAYLRTGQTLDAEKIEQLQQEDGYERGKDAAMNLITYRPRSEREIEQKLRQKKFEPNTIERVLTRLRELDLVNDAAFARYWIDQRETFKPRSRMALRQELQQKGISREIVDELLEEIDENTAAFRAVEKKALRWRSLPEDEYRRKVTGFLQRRGFHYGIVRDVLDQLDEQFDEAEQMEE